MRTAFKALIAATAMAGAATIASAPANADGLRLSIGPGGGISFSVNTGGYCDRWGCPDDYWGYPVFYGPVYYGGSWYRGPLYYRYSSGSYWYWVHGGWRRDEWRGPRPGWARNYRYGPALSLDYYRSHGFSVRDNDWNRYRVWGRTHNWDRDHRDWGRGNDWNHDGGDHRFGGDNNRHDQGGFDRYRSIDRDIHPAHSELRGARQEQRGDRNDFLNNRHALHNDVQQGAGRQQIHQDQRALQNSRQELHQNRQDKHGDRQDVKKDRSDGNPGRHDDH